MTPEEIISSAVTYARFAFDIHGLEGCLPPATGELIHLGFGLADEPLFRTAYVAEYEALKVKAFNSLVGVEDGECAS